jgi:hypothetical protein
MNRAILRNFQRDAVEQSYRALADALRLFEQAKLIPDARAEIISQNQGGLLIDAPTGVGKTLMAGRLAEKLSADFKMLWLWFSPFSGIVEQTRLALAAECPGLHPKSPASGRNVRELRSGDVFISTWSAAAARDKESRKMHQESETQPSLANMLEAARADGFYIGVVIDEAHHGFRKERRALEFVRDIVRPEICVFMTATPRDAETKAVADSLKLKKFSRVSVSREDGVAEGLLKYGVKVGLFRAPQNTPPELLGFNRAALKMALTTHRKIKSALAEIGAQITPLLMAQADESPDGVAAAQKMLNELGMPDSAIRVHTAAEPDPDFISIAKDESAEALIFKMAAATGFDAPRAFVLASLRRIRDSDFGLQIVGRIMRKPRALHDKKNLPPLLEYGYVFLADHESQQGLAEAAERINAIKTAIAPVAGNVSIFTVGGKDVLQETAGGQGNLNITPATPENEAEHCEDGGSASGDEPSPYAENAAQTTLAEMGVTEIETSPPDAPAADLPPQTPTAAKQYRYPLRRDLENLPACLSRAIPDADRADDFTRDVVNLFPMERAVGEARREAMQVLMVTVDLFKKEANMPDPQKVNVELAEREVRRLAQRTLDEKVDDNYLHPRQFYPLMQKRLAEECEKNGWKYDGDFLEKGVYKIIALCYRDLRGAFGDVFARTLVAEDAEPLPAEIISEEKLNPARLNIYGVYPAQMNGWEKKFAEYLELEAHEHIHWWHRNPARARHAAAIKLPGAHGYFYPDFVVGVKERRGKNGILLVETKRDINDYRGNALAKARTKHPAYGAALMLLLDDNNCWRIVKTDENQERNYPADSLIPNILQSV